MRSGAGSLDERTVERLVGEYVDTNQVLGLSIALVQGGELAYAHGFGRTSVETSHTVTPDTLFGIGSISKTLLGSLITRLVETGELDLRRPVVEYLPGFTFSEGRLGQQITLEHLLSHTSGLPGAGKDWGPADPDALGRFVWEQLTSHEFVVEPGRVHLYSSTAICMAGYIAEVVTGTPYRQLIRQQVCEPLQMGQTTFDHAVASPYPIALPHRAEAGGTLESVHRLADNRSGESSGFAMSSAIDLDNLAIAHLNRGRFAGSALLSPAGVARIHAPIGAWRCCHARRRWSWRRPIPPGPITPALI